MDAGFFDGEPRVNAASGFYFFTFDSSKKLADGGITVRELFKGKLVYDLINFPANPYSSRCSPVPSGWGWRPTRTFGLHRLDGLPLCIA